MSAEEFLKIADLLPEALFLVCADGTVLAANQGAARRLGCSSGGLAGQPLGHLVSDSPEVVSDYLRDCSRSRACLPGLLTLRVTGGQELACRASGAAITPRTEDRPATILLRLVPKSEAPSQFAILGQRIEELTREVARRKRLERELREQEEWFRTVLSSIGDAVIATDRAGRVLFLNQVAAGLTGWESEEALGHPLDEVFRIVQEETREPAESPVAKVLREGCVVGLANHTILIARDGTEWAIDDSGAPIRNDEGEMLGVVLVFREVNEQRRVQSELRRYTAELTEADRRKNEFLAMLAHELRNPLAPIINSVHVLRARGPAEQVLQRHRDIIERQARHMARLVDDLLEVTRITRGMIELRKERTDLRLAVENAAETVGPLMEEKQHRLSVSLPEQPLCVLGDPHRLSQIAGNLLNNAARYTQPGGDIEVVLERVAEDAVLRVRDSGEGIVPELLPRIFDLFTQGSRSLARQEGGLGVGLTLVRTLVEAHGGTIDARSDGAGKGSEFVVRLPAVEESAASAEKRQAAAAVSARKRILLVEDNLDAAETLADLLTIWGHEVRVTHDGFAGLEVAAEFEPEVVLLDLGLPGMDGYTVARRLREAGCPADRCRLIAVSGYGQEDDVRRAEEAGFDYHLTKPVDLRVLERLIGGGEGSGR